jgi:hypothetical protein
MGKLASKIVEPIRLSSQLNSIHLSLNNLPPEIMLYIDRALTVSQIDPPERKVTRFRDIDDQNSARQLQSNQKIEEDTPRLEFLERDSRFNELQNQLAQQMKKKINET